MARTTIAIFLTTLWAAGLAGCAAPNDRVPYARDYPLWEQDAAASRGAVLDIQVFRKTKHLEFTNTTARAFGPSTIWLNGWFSRPIDSLAVGESVRIPLSEFRDRHSEAFRGGGFFATEEPDTLVTAELETTDQDGGTVLYRLVVVGGEDGS
jgi:hypothetical protein